MLRAIHLKRFGMFDGDTFALGPVTIFSGANQSGKSTVFDAIRIHAFGPDKRLKENRALFSRYGEDTQVSLDWNGDPPDMSDATFMNLFAISGGDAAMDLDGDWLAAVKKNLFAGGIDPRNLIDAFERLASGRGTYAHMKQRSRLVAQRDETEAQLAGHTGERERILAGLAGRDAREGGLKGLTARLGALKGEEAELAAEVAFQERIAERAAQEQTLALLARVEELERAQSGRPQLAVDRTAELDALEQAVTARESERLRGEQALEAARGLAAVHREDAARLERELALRRPWRGGLEALESRRAGFEAGRFTRMVMRGAMAVFSVMLGVGALVGSGLALWGYLVLGGALAAALALAWLPGWVDEWRLLREMKELWRSRLGNSIGPEEAQLVLEASTLAGIRAALERVRADLEHLERDAAQKAEVLKGAQEDLDKKEGDTTERRLGAEGAESERRHWLASVQAENRDAYRDQLGEYRRVQQELAEAYRLVETLQAAGEFPDAFHLRADAERRLKELDTGGVPREGAPDAERRAGRERLEKIRAEFTALENERHALDRESHGAAERLAGELGRLPEEIAGLGEDIRALEAEIATLDFDRRAAARALELFQEVAADESAVLAELAGGVAEVFARLSGVSGTGEVRRSAVTLSGLKHEGIQALDRGGPARPAGQLSSGARHRLYLALRLEMAHRERQGRFALLCLDEPFVYLDPERQMETLQYLREFIAETGWQLILFTNDPSHADRARAVFPDCRAHGLD